MLLRYIVCLLLLCVVEFNAQGGDLVGDLVGGVGNLVGGVVEGVVDVVEGLPEVFTSAISRGNDASPGQFPYQLGLYGTRGHFCGASLISHVWTLTAAHCFYGRPTYNPAVVQVYAGSIYLNDGQRYNVRNIILYPGYRVQNMVDVAVLNTEFIPYSAYVQPIVMAPRAVQNNDCIVSGWGLLGERGSSTKADTLQYSTEHVITLAECSRSWPQVDQSKICTRRGPTNSGPRPGDSGGPLVIGTRAGYRQVGIVSGSAPGRPQIYTSIFFVRGWVTRVTGVQ